MAGRRQPLASPFLLIQGGTRAKVRTLTITGATLTDNGGGEAELVISGGGGGAWTLTGITGTASRIAGFSALGAATYYQIGTDLQAWDPDLDALAALGNGLPYRSGGTWGAYGLGDLSISGASVQVTQARGLRETAGPTTLTMGAVADGKLLGRNGTTIGGVSISTGLTLSAGALSVDTTTIATLAAVAAAYQPLDAGLTSLTSADATAGLPYVTGANTWVTATLGDLYVSGGAWRVSNLPTTDQKAALAGSSGTPNSTNPYVTSADARLTGASGGAAVAAAAEYGTGQHGNLTLDGVNTYSGILTLSGGNTYTVDGGVVLNALNLTINNGITLKPAGSPIRVLGLLTWNGTIDANGSASSGQPAGSGAAPALAPALTNTGNVYTGGDTGAAGAVSNVPGGANTFTNSAICCGGQGGNGGKGVYSATTRAGGSAVLASSSVQYDFFHGELQALLQLGRADSGSSRLYLGGGGGGAAGGNSTGSGGGTLNSGGGGGGGGILAIFARTATIGASAVAQADGGAGGNAPYTSPTLNAGSGGGGGGGGGVVFLKVGQVVGTQQLPAIYARGGAGGAANYVGAGYGDGGNGGTGGKIYCIVANYTGSAPTTANTGGAAGAGAGTGGASGTAGSTGAVNVYNSL